MAPTTTRIDFASTNLTQYSGFYAAIIDDVFTPEECLQLVQTAASSGRNWEPAGLSAQGDTQTVHRNFRNSDRIYYVDPETSKMICERLRPLVERDIGKISPGDEFDMITGKKGRKQGSTWKLVGVNPRLSFLRYGAGHYFKQHCDGLYDTTLEDGTYQKSFVTLHLYLNGHEGEELPDTGSKLFPDDPDEPLQGGSTRFWTPNKKHFIDVLPRVGRVLVFQQRMLVHSGEEVTQGIKYTMRSDFMYEETA